MSFPRYPQYKDSGVEWLGEVPEHWEVCPAKRRLAARSGGNEIKGRCASEPAEGLFPAFSASGQDVWVDEHTFDCPGVVLSAVGARCGKTFRADGQWSAVANTHCLFPIEQAHRDFLWYLTNQEDWWEKGGTAQPFVKVTETLARHGAFPPPVEQAAIATFLDRETAKIDALIAEQQRLIELLKEKRQAVISHAVTKGLNADAPMKDSGIEWLGEVPEHWEVRKVSQLFRASKGKNGPLLTKEYCAAHAGDYPVYSGQTENEGVMGTWDQYDFDFGAEGVLFSTTVGSAKVMSVRHLFGKFSLSQNCMIIWTRTNVCLTHFFFYHFQPLFAYEKALIPQHMQASFRMEDLYGYRIAVPPKYEQEAVVAFLDSVTSQFDTLVAEAELAITLLQERRSALISAAVTGQVDVRGLAGSEAA